MKIHRRRFAILVGVILEFIVLNTAGGNREPFDWTLSVMLFSFAAYAVGYAAVMIVTYEEEE